uniref:NADH-ubiquinone oxidoreductase chain 3 n=1 Tax=Naesiotus nux TaxID=1755238 RepID=A0A0S2IAS9_NAENU|nr:NADH dehydrogenase subunit 3 [Naesiotus nux]ALO20565.1 NADH dehydrogenase subunit 3 [Naesiotus nux]
MGLIISVALLMISSLLSWTSPLSVSKMSPFECGFEPLSQMRLPYSTRFIILMLLFLIFDIEVILLLPYVNLSSLSLNLLSTTHIFMFLLILFLGLLHEWHQGSIDWSPN